MLYDVIDEFHLSVLNTGEITRIACPPFHNSRVDISLCSSRFSLNCVWSVVNDPAGSDHLPIHITFSTKLI